jgi:hypothetical protein
MQHKRQFAVAGVFTAAATVVVGVVIALGGQPAEQPSTRPAGQVEFEAPATSTESRVPTTSDSPAPASPETPDVADDVPVNQPAEPAQDAPAPGVPYDSDGATVAPNPTNMAPGELAPRPPTQNPVEPAPAPVEPPVIPGQENTPAP